MKDTILKQLDNIIAGIDQSYEAVEHGYTEEALLHLGHHLAALQRLRKQIVEDGINV